MKIINEIPFAQGNTTHGDVRNAINLAISISNENFAKMEGWHTSLTALEANNVPVSLDHAGYMTPDLLIRLQSAEAAGDNFADAKLSGEGNGYSYTLKLEKGQFTPVRLSLPVHGGDDGTTAASSAALVDVEAFGYLAEFMRDITKYRKTLELLKPATTLQDGYMSKELASQVEWNKNSCANFADSTLGVTANEYSFQLNFRKGQYAPVDVDIPVHGGGDGTTPERTAAMISPTEFEHIVDYGLKMAEYHEMLRYMPYEVDHVVNGVEVNLMSSLVDGVLVYDENRGKFLWQVTTESGLKEYFDSAKKDERVGQYPQAGRIFFTKLEKRLFIGTGTGASELLNTKID